jgi:DNA-binding XRE family transcriptional regulator
MNITILNGYDYSKDRSVIDVSRLDQLLEVLPVDCTGLRVELGGEHITLKLVETVETYHVTAPEPKPAKPAKPKPGTPGTPARSKAERLAEARRTGKLQTKDSPAVLKRKGAKLRRLRKRKGLTQDQLAAEAGIARSVVSALEQGQTGFEGKCGAVLAVFLDTTW